MNSVLMFAEQSQSRNQRRLLLALLVVIVISSIAFSELQVLLNTALCALFGLGFEAIARLMRRLPGRGLLRDENTLLLACLLGLCLPPGTVWWQLALAMAFAVLLVKHAYGGAGPAPFHPAMAALLLLWLSFPETAQNWPANSDYWLLINLLAFCAGIYLLAVRAVAWQISAGIFSALVLMPLLLDYGGAGSPGNYAFRMLIGGGTMLTAFFIATDPASSAMTRSGKFVYGLLIGSIMFSIRIWGEWPEGFPAAVILGNFLAPLLDQAMRRPRYGHVRKLLTRSRPETEL